MHMYLLRSRVEIDYHTVYAYSMIEVKQIHSTSVELYYRSRVELTEDSKT